MNVVTIMNYDDSKIEYIKMCKIFITQLIKHNPDCKLRILYNHTISQHIKDHASKFKQVRLVDMPGASPSESWSQHHNIKFKLFNLTRIDDPFIFLDSDIFCISSLDHLWRLRNQQPFIGVNHQYIPEHPATTQKKFLNSGVQIVGDPEWYKFNNFRETHRRHGGRLQCSGWDQAHIFTYCNDIGYNYTHPDVGYGWNSCAGFCHTEITDKEKGDFKCTYNGPDDNGLKISGYPVYLNHYWWNYKPWNINCPIYNYFNEK
jgi:hypothetical protein